MNRISRQVEALEPSGIRDFFELVMGMDNVISLGVGEPDFVTPRHIREAAVQSLQDGLTNYTSNYGMLRLRKAIARKLLEKYDLDYDPEHEILVTTGVSEAMDLFMRATVDPGTGVLIPSPSYVSYRPTARLAGGEPQLIETSSEQDFRLQPEQLISRISTNSRILVLNYPSNPTGTSYTREQLENLAEVAREQNLLVVSDEIYGQLSYDFPHVPLPTLPGMKERCVLLDGFSKAYAMTGFRLGFAAGPPDVIRAMTKIHQYTMLCAPTMAQFAAIEALSSGDSAVQSMKDEYELRRNLVVQRFRRMGLPCTMPQGAFYAFPSIQPTGLDPETFCRNLLESKKVAVIPGNAFGPGGEQNVRVSYAAGKERLIKALNLMEEFLQETNLREEASQETGATSSKNV